LKKSLKLLLKVLLSGKVINLILKISLNVFDGLYCITRLFIASMRLPPHSPQMLMDVKLDVAHARFSIHKVDNK